MEESMNLTLLVDKRTQKIVYAEAGKDFVDLLFSFLIMPIGSVMKLLSSSPLEKIGSINNLYDSMDKLPSVYMKSDKSVLLNPILDSAFCHKTLSIDYGESRYYVCGRNANYSNQTHYITSQKGKYCLCGGLLEYAVRFGGNDNSSKALQTSIESSPFGKSGFVAIDNSRNCSSTSTGSRSRCDYVKETVTFMITDDLTISPSSTISIIVLLNRMNINDISQLEQKSVMVGPPQAVKLLWASLVSTSALNDVFSSTLSMPANEGSKQMDGESVGLQEPNVETREWVRADDDDISE